jgi:hypothetical protein
LFRECHSRPMPASKRNSKQANVRNPALHRVAGLAGVIAS